jgi:hypothetical protein
MGKIDPADDSISRFIVWHYHYVEKNHERKLEAIAAFSSLAEANQEFTRKSEELGRLQELGMADLKEYYSCGFRAAGYGEQSKINRLTLKVLRSRLISREEPGEVRSGVSKFGWGRRTK